MDYSSFYPSILLTYFGSFAGVIFLVILFICGEVFLIKQYLKSKAVIEIIGMFACVVIIIAISHFFRQYFKDIPNVINRNYIIATGTVVIGNNGGTESETRDFTLKKDDGETIRILANYMPIQNGDEFEVIYLPNTGCGAIIRKIKGGELP